MKQKIYPLGTKRTFVTQFIRTRIKCNHKGCKKYITGVEGYNGKFFHYGNYACDLRHQTWTCNKHIQDEKIL